MPIFSCYPEQNDKLEWWNQWPFSPLPSTNVVMGNTTFVWVSFQTKITLKGGGERAKLYHFHDVEGTREIIQTDETVSTVLSEVVVGDHVSQEWEDGDFYWLPGLLGELWPCRHHFLSFAMIFSEFISFINITVEKESCLLQSSGKSSKQFLLPSLKLQ